MFAEREVLSLIVRCPSTKTLKGCEWSGEIRYLKVRKQKKKENRRPAHVDVAHMQLHILHSREFHNQVKVEAWAQQISSSVSRVLFSALMFFNIVGSDTTPSTGNFHLCMEIKQSAC